jgi:hypothetical protein
LTRPVQEYVDCAEQIQICHIVADVITRSSSFSTQRRTLLAAEVRGEWVCCRVASREIGVPRRPGQREILRFAQDDRLKTERGHFDPPLEDLASFAEALGASWVNFPLDLSGCRSGRLLGGTTGRWDVHRCGNFPCLQTAAASRAAIIIVPFRFLGHRAVPSPPSPAVATRDVACKSAQRLAQRLHTLRDQHSV